VESSYIHSQKILYSIVLNLCVLSYLLLHLSPLVLAPFYILCFIDIPLTSDERSRRIQISQSHPIWLPEWENHLIRVPDTQLIPPSASAINTPLVQSSWGQCLQQHPTQKLVQFFLQGITKGFRIGYKGQREKLKTSKNNLQSAILHPQVVDEHIYTELAAQRWLVLTHQMDAHLQRSADSV